MCIGLFAGQQPIAQDEARPLHNDSTIMATDIAEKKIVNQVRMIKLVDVASNSGVVNEIAVARGVLHHEVSGGFAEDPSCEQAALQRRTSREFGRLAGANVDLGNDP